MITSSVVAKKLEAALEKEGIKAKFHQCKYSDVPSTVESVKADLIVSTGKMGDFDSKGVPVITGTSFLTGVRVKATIDEILETLESEGG